MLSIPLHGRKLRASPLVIGQVLGVHLDESAIVDGAVDTAGLRPVARLGGPADYTVVSDVFQMVRPSE